MALCLAAFRRSLGLRIFPNRFGLSLLVFLGVALTGMTAQTSAPAAETPAAEGEAAMNYTPRDPGFDKLDAIKQQEIELKLEITPDTASPAVEGESPAFIVRLTMLYRQLTPQSVGEVTLWWSAPDGQRTAVPLRLMREGFWATRIVPEGGAGTHKLTLVAIFENPKTAGIGKIIEQNYALDLPETLLARTAERMIDTQKEDKARKKADAEAVHGQDKATVGGVVMLFGALNLIVLIGLGIGVGMLMHLPAALREKLERAEAEEPENAAIAETREILLSSGILDPVQAEPEQSAAVEPDAAPQAPAEAVAQASPQPEPAQPAPAAEAIAANEALRAMEQTVAQAESAPEQTASIPSEATAPAAEAATAEAATAEAATAEAATAEPTAPTVKAEHDALEQMVVAAVETATAEAETRLEAFEATTEVEPTETFSDHDITDMLSAVPQPEAKPEPEPEIAAEPSSAPAEGAQGNATDDHLDDLLATLAMDAPGENQAPAQAAAKPQPAATEADVLLSDDELAAMFAAAEAETGTEATS